MEIDIEWTRLGPRSEGWRTTRCLYAYCNPANDQILYIGKADGPTVRQRFTATDKESLFEYLEKEHGIDTDDVDVILGDLIMAEGSRLTRELLADVESLLIKRLKSVGNVSSKQSRISRPGLVVRCHGQWPHPRSRFVDIG